MARKYLKNLQTMGKCEAARAAGYSNTTANHPFAIERSKTFKELIKKELPDDLILTKIHDGLNANHVEVAKFNGQITEEREYADYATRHRYLETAIKLRGDIAETSVNAQFNIIVNGADNGYTPEA